MVMPRPSGKAQKIAEQVIPGLNRNRDYTSMKNRRVEKVPNDAVEMKIVNINEHLGRAPKNKTRKIP